MGSKGVFAVPLEKGLASAALWWMLLLLVGFMITVGMITRIADRAAEGNRCTEQFVARTIEEVMMFGAVAITLLMVSELADLSEEIILLIHFVDVLCTLAAAMLITVGCWSWLLIRWSRQHQRRMFKESFTGHVTGRDKIDFLVAGAHISAIISHEVDFGTYVHEVVSQVIVDLIDISALSWSAGKSPPPLPPPPTLQNLVSPLSHRVCPFVTCRSFGWTSATPSLPPSPTSSRRRRRDCTRLHRSRERMGHGARGVHVGVRELRALPIRTGCAPRPRLHPWDADASAHVRHVRREPRTADDDAGGSQDSTPPFPHMSHPVSPMGQKLILFYARAAQHLGCGGHHL